MALILCNGHLRVNDLPIKQLQLKDLRNVTERVVTEGPAPQSGSASLVQEGFEHQVICFWSHLRSCPDNGNDVPNTSYCAVYPLLTKRVETETSSGLFNRNEGCGCVTSHRTTAGPREYRSNLWIICANTPPANPLAHPTSAFALSCFLMQSEKYTKSIQPAEQRHELGMSAHRFLAPKRAFQPDRVEIQIQVLSSEFLPLHTEYTMPMHTPDPCTEGFLFTVETSV